MKLFLSSLAISPSQLPVFMELVGKEKPSDVKIHLILNAADVYAEENREWMHENLAAIQAHGFETSVIDLRNYKNKSEELLAELGKADAIWLGGGNTYYLRWILRETGADEMIKKLVSDGKVYGGGSAGAIIAGPTLKCIEPIDDPVKAPEVIYDGLGLTDNAVVPHWGTEKYAETISEVERNLQDAGFKTEHITGEQAVVINGASQKLVG